MSDDPAGRLRVLIVAGYPALRAGLTALLAYEADIEPITESVVETEPPDLIVADAGTLTDNALDDLADRFPDAPLILIGGELDQFEPSFLAFPGGYLPGDIDGAGLAAAVRAVAQGLTVIAPGLLSSINASTPELDPHDAGLLTPREREVLALIAEGLPNKGIARELGISEHTAKFHVGSVLGKLGASSRAEAVTLATRRGLLTV
ncbi:MAG: response regulator transcription factor [Thermomicrobiales bacterium]|nr:response regulator transcription factor [Thermomicrobiales bacterium]